MTNRSSHNDRIKALANEFIDRKQRGEDPTIKEYCVKHPDLAQNIREVFPTITMIEDLKPKKD